MPTASARDEHKWGRAKEIAVKAGRGEDYAYIMGIYKKMDPDYKFKSGSEAKKGLSSSIYILKGLGTDPAGTESAPAGQASDHEFSWHSTEAAPWRPWESSGHVSVGKGQLKHVLENGTYSIVSGGRNGKNPNESHLPHDHDTFKQRHEALRGDLDQHGYAYTEVDGDYDGPEKSFIVYHHPDHSAKGDNRSFMVHHESPSEFSHIRELGKKHGQDSVIHSHGNTHEMHYTTGEHEGAHHKGEQYNVLPHSAGEDYTEVEHPHGDLTKFNLNFDWDNKHGFDSALHKAADILKGMQLPSMPSAKAPRFGVHLHGTRPSTPPGAKTKGGYTVQEDPVTGERKYIKPKLNPRFDEAFSSQVRDKDDPLHDVLSRWSRGGLSGRGHSRGSVGRGTMGAQGHEMSTDEAARVQSAARNILASDHLNIPDEHQQIAKEVLQALLEELEKQDAGEDSQAKGEDPMSKSLRGAISVCKGMGVKRSIGTISTGEHIDLHPDHSSHADLTPDGHREAAKLHTQHSERINAKQRELAQLEAQFEAQGGRGVSLAERIDALRASGFDAADAATAHHNVSAAWHDAKADFKDGKGKDPGSYMDVAYSRHGQGRDSDVLGNPYHAGREMYQSKKGGGHTEPVGKGMMPPQPGQQPPPPQQHQAPPPQQQHAAPPGEPDEQGNFVSPRDGRTYNINTPEGQAEMGRVEGSKHEGKPHGAATESMQARQQMGGAQPPMQQAPAPQQAPPAMMKGLLSQGGIRPLQPGVLKATPSGAHRAAQPNPFFMSKGADSSVCEKCGKALSKGSSTCKSCNGQGW